MITYIIDCTKLDSIYRQNLTQNSYRIVLINEKESQKLKFYENLKTSGYSKQTVGCNLYNSRNLLKIKYRIIQLKDCMNINHF